MTTPSDDPPIPPPPFGIPNQSSDAPPVFPGSDFGQRPYQTQSYPGQPTYQSQPPYAAQPPYPGQQPGGYPQFPAQAPFGYQSYGAPFGSVTKTSGMAIASMVLGICGIVLFCFFAIPSLLATIFGGVALGQIKRSQGVVTGRGMAIAGLVLGLVGIGLFAIFLAAGNFHWNTDT